MLDYIIAGDDLAEFLADFPAVTQAEAIAALEKIKAALDEGRLAEPVSY